MSTPQELEKARAEAERLRDALRVIATKRPNHCTLMPAPSSCRHSTAKTRTPGFNEHGDWSNGWCNACIAADALETLENPR